MRIGDGIRAFSDSRYDYYRLTCDIGDMLSKGTIFVHDPADDIYGSAAEGCLKMCWTPDGSCYNSLCAGTVIFHASFMKSDLFEKVDIAEMNKSIDLITNELSVGNYELEIHADGSWTVQKFGSRA